MLAESSGCRNARRRAREFPVLPCAFPALRGFASCRAAQGSTGKLRERARCAARRHARCAARATRAALQQCTEKARTVPRGGSYTL